MSMNKSQLNTLIEHYFNGDTSVEEERILRNELATTRLDSPEINEARAVMGYGLAQYNRRSHRSEKKHWLRAVASVAIIALLSTTGYHLSQSGNVTPDCIAYIDGQRITDNDKVIDMMFEGLSNIADAAEASQTQTISSLENLISAMNQLESF